MIIDIIVILKFYLIFKFHRIKNGVSVFGTHVRIRTPYIPLDKLYIIDESIRKITIRLLILILRYL